MSKTEMIERMAVQYSILWDQCLEEQKMATKYEEAEDFSMFNACRHIALDYKKRMHTVEATAEVLGLNFSKLEDAAWALMVEREQVKKVNW